MTIKEHGYQFYYRLVCYNGFRNNNIYEGRSFPELAKSFYGYRSSARSKEIMIAYDNGCTNAYYHIHLVMVYPDGSEKIINTSRGL